MALSVAVAPLAVAACGPSISPAPSATSSAPRPTAPASAPQPTAPASGGLAASLADPTAPAGAASAGPLTLRVGAIYDVSGPQSSLDSPSAAGARLAASDPTLPGRGREVSIGLSLVDGGAGAGTLAERAAELAGRSDVGIGLSDTDGVLAAAPPFQAVGVPFVTSGATSPALPAQVGDRLWLACFGDNVQAAAGAEYAAKAFGMTAVVLFDTSADYTRGLSRYFIAAFRGLGGTVNTIVPYPGHTTSLASRAGQIAGATPRPDFVYLAALPTNVGNLVRSLRDAGIAIPILGGDGLDTPDLVAQAGPTADGVAFTTHAFLSATDGSPAVRAFVAKYRAAYGEDPPNAFAALGYDTVALVADAAARAGSPDPAAIQRALGATVDFPGVTGRITFADGSHIPRKEVAIVEIRDGKPQLAATIMPGSVPAP